MQLTMMSKTFSVTVSLALSSLLLLAGCSSGPKEAEFETAFREALNEPELKAKGGVAIAKLDSEMFVDAERAKVTYSGQFVLESDLYEKASRRSEALDAVGEEIEKDGTMAALKAMDFEGDFSSRFQSLLKRNGLGEPTVYQKAARKGQTVDFQGEASATKYPDGWKFEISELERARLITEAAAGFDARSAKLMKDLEGDLAFFEGETDAHAFAKAFIAKAKTVLPQAVALLEAQDAENARVKKSLLEAVPVGGFWRAEMTFGRQKLPVFLRIDKVDAGDLSVEASVLNGDHWDRERQFRGELSFNLGGSKHLRLISSASDAVADGGYFLAEAKEFSLSLDVAVDGLSNRSVSFTPIASEEAKRIGGEIEAHWRRLNEMIAEGVSFHGRGTRANGETLDLMLEISEINKEAQTVAAYLIDQDDERARRPFVGRYFGPASRKDCDLTLETESKWRVEYGHKNWFQGSGFSMLMDLRPDGLSGKTSGGSGVELAVQTDEWKAERVAAKERYRRKVENATEAGKAYRGSLSRPSKGDSGEIVIEMLERSADMQTVSLLVIEPLTGLSRQYMGSLLYDEGEAKGLQVRVRPVAGATKEQRRSKLRIISTSSSKNGISLSVEDDGSLAYGGEADGGSDGWEGRFSPVALAN